ncbi:protein Brevis radix-like 4 [Primulina huaijiensis]|uniref:protein Brevis radix-like 4 n=1 Tax=Primulina huaijiensis TaxID=1492673 RepID=UPI003CC75074
MSSSRDCSSEDVEKHKKPAENLSSQIKRIALIAYGHCTPCRRHPAELQLRNGSFSAGVELDEFRRSNCSSTEGKVKGICGGGGIPAVANDRRVNPVVFEEESEPKEWVAQVERGVLITFVSLPGGINDLKRIRFSKEMFDKGKADKWWAENSENLMELYNVKRQTLLHGPNEYCTTPVSSDNSMQSPSSSNLCGIFSTTRTSLPHDSVSEWVEQDEPGVYVTIRAIPDGRRELRRIRFRREKFREKEARLWWEENRERIKKKYL